MTDDVSVGRMGTVWSTCLSPRKLLVQARLRHRLSHRGGQADGEMIVELANLVIYGKPPMDWTTHALTLRFS